jgi:hypothetical protein
MLDIGLAFDIHFNITVVVILTNGTSIVTPYLDGGNQLIEVSMKLQVFVSLQWKV